MGEMWKEVGQGGWDRCRQLWSCEAFSEVEVVAEHGCKAAASSFVCLMPPAALDAGLTGGETFFDGGVGAVAVSAPGAVGVGTSGDEDNVVVGQVNGFVGLFFTGELLETEAWRSVGWRGSAAVSFLAFLLSPCAFPSIIFSLSHLHEGEV